MVIGLLAPGLQSASLLDHTSTLVSQVRYQHYSTSHLNQGVKIIPFWTSSLKMLGMVRILSWQTSSTHKNWMHPLMRLIACLQSVHGFSASLVPFLIILDHSLLLASNLVNYGARLWWALLLPVPQAGKMSASKLIHYFASSSSIWIPGFLTIW